MDKIDFFMGAMKSGAYMERSWVINAFAVTLKRKTITEATYAYEIITDPSDDKALFTAIPTETGFKAVKINGTSLTEPVIDAGEAVQVNETMHPLFKGLKDVRTSYGIIFGNMAILWYPFKGKIPYVNGRISKEAEDVLRTNLHDNVPNIEDEEEGKFYVREFIEYCKGVDYIKSFDFIFASSGSEATMTVAQSVLDVRDKLIAENAHRLHERPVQAMIDEATKAADKASFKGDAAAQAYLIKGKSFDPVRKKKFITLGAQGGMGDPNKATYIKNSLRDGWAIKDIPAYANESRAGSYFRGKETQYGGSDVKTALRAMMNSRVAEEFCKTMRGLPINVNDGNKSKLIGRYAINKDKTVLITSMNIASLVGKNIEVRSPQYCKTAGASFCAQCIGVAYSRLPDGIPSMVSHIGDVHMNDKMKRMHGKPLIATRINLNYVTY